MLMIKLEVGQQVRVSPIGWSDGAQKKLSGKTGVITEINPHQHDNRPYLVTFKTPPYPWWRYQRPTCSWWFAGKELTVIHY